MLYLYDFESSKLPYYHEICTVDVTIQPQVIIVS